MDDPLQSFKAESDRRLQDIKVTPELRQRTLARIQQSGRKKRVRQPFTWAAAACLLVIIATLIWTGSEPDKDLHLAEVPENGPVHPFSEPGEDTIDVPQDMRAEGADPQTGCIDCDKPFTTMGTPMGTMETNEMFHAPLPSYIPDGFTLSESVRMDTSEGPQWHLHYTSQDQKHYTIVVTLDEGAEPREPSIVDEGPPLVVEWAIDKRIYRLTGTINREEALKIGASVTDE